jgi:hypothetical protein
MMKQTTNAMVAQVLGYTHPGVGYQPPMSHVNFMYGGIRENFDVQPPPLDPSDKEQASQRLVFILSCL